MFSSLMTSLNKFFIRDICYSIKIVCSISKKMHITYKKLFASFFSFLFCLIKKLVKFFIVFLFSDFFFKLFSLF
nr:MAG TPA: hypothetical protein [Bacteriophage sp.]